MKISTTCGHLFFVSSASFYILQLWNHEVIHFQEIGRSYVWKLMSGDTKETRKLQFEIPWCWLFDHHRPLYVLCGFAMWISFVLREPHYEWSWICIKFQLVSIVLDSFTDLMTFSAKPVDHTTAKLSSTSLLWGDFMRNVNSIRVCWSCVHLKTNCDWMWTNKCSAGRTLQKPTTWAKTITGLQNRHSFQ